MNPHNDYDDFDGFCHVIPAPDLKGGYLVMRTPLPTEDTQPEDEVIAVFVCKARARERAEDYAAACNRGNFLCVPGGRYVYEVEVGPEGEQPTLLQ